MCKRVFEGYLLQRYPSILCIPIESFTLEWRLSDMTLREHILTYERGGEIVASLFNYYDTFITTLDPEFTKYSYRKTKLVLCYMKDHNDVNPSMGYINHKTLKGVMQCHCFGCGRTADVVRLHQLLMQQYRGTMLSEKEACMQLAEMFDIPVDAIEPDEDPAIRFERKMRAVTRVSRNYSANDFRRNLLDLRSSNNATTDRINSECVKMIATQKKLYY